MIFFPSYKYIKNENKSCVNNPLDYNYYIFRNFITIFPACCDFKRKNRLI